MGGCAKFPADGAGNRYTRLIFRFTMDGPVNPNYIYAVAIRPLVSTTGNVNDLPADDGKGPVPVLSYNNSSLNPNGYVAGQPTRLILYKPAESANKYLVYKFLPTGNANNPVSLVPVLSGDIITNSGVDPDTPPAGVDSNTLGFTIETLDLVDTPAQAQQLAGIQFNIITANKPLVALGDENSRGTDAIGNQSDLSQATLNAYFTVSLQTSNTYPQGASPVLETTGDVYGVSQPAIDMKSWSLDVRTP